MVRLVLSLSFFLSVALHAATLSGFVRDSSDGENLPNATIAFDDLPLGTLSNTEGYYAVQGIPAGTHAVTFSYIGQRALRDTLRFTADQQLRFNADMVRESIRIEEETLVTADRLQDELRRQASVTALQVQTLERLPSVGEPDLLRSLQLLPGVQSASDISSGLYVRGGGPDQTRILLDNVPLYNPAHAFGFFSTFNPDAIKDVTFYKGAYPAQYGGNLGAVLDVQNREGNRRKVSGRGGISLISGRLLVEGPVKNGSWMLAGRRTYLDPILAAVRAAGSDVPDYYFYDFNGKLNRQLSERDNLVVSAYLGSDRLDFDLDPDSDTFFNIKWGNRALTSRWTRVFTPALFGRFMAFFSEYESDISLSFFDTPVSYSNQVQDLSLKADFDYFASATHTLKSGVQLSYYEFDFDSAFNQQEQESLDTEPLLLSTYIQDDWQLTPLTNARIGLRASYFDEGEHYTLEPRFSLSRVLQPGWRLKLAGGLYHQYLQLVTSEGFSGGDFWVPLDETVEPGRSWQAVTGLEWEPSQRYLFSAEAYYTDLAHLVVLDNNTVADSDQTRSEDLFKTEGTGYATGLELFLEKRTGKLRGWLGYTLGWTRRTFADIDGGRSFAPKYDRRHDASLTTTYQRGKWIWSANFVYGTGQAFTPASARYTLRDPATRLFEDRALPSRRNTGRLLPYHRMDLGLRRTLKLFGSDAEFYLQIFNAYSRRNEWFVQYDTDNPQTEPEVVKMLPVVPTFGLNFAF
ncbi:MAG: TonB-dependent receptor [Candidatus Latescibacterota bacterium]|jgi:hypothetical protein